ncbi:MAG: hypothetical protein JKY88_01235, partial [Pseudomonadales bacterium]|nr:hypothetical protein [Pseudomonadales bacterium]
MKYKFLLVAIIASTFVFTTFSASEEPDPVNASTPTVKKQVRKSKKRKASDDTNKRSKISRESAVVPALAASSSSSSSAVVASSSSRAALPHGWSPKPSGLARMMAQLLKRGKNPAPNIPVISAKQEMVEGSRRWTRGFVNEETTKSHQWHIKMAKVVKLLSSNRGQYLVQNANIAVCSFCFCKADGSLIGSRNEV